MDAVGGVLDKVDQAKGLWMRLGELAASLPLGRASHTGRPIPCGSPSLPHARLVFLFAHWIEKARLDDERTELTV